MILRWEKNPKEAISVHVELFRREMQSHWGLWRAGYARGDSRTTAFNKFLIETNWRTVLENRKAKLQHGVVMTQLCSWIKNNEIGKFLYLARAALYPNTGV